MIASAETGSRAMQTGEMLPLLERHKIQVLLKAGFSVKATAKEASPSSPRRKDQAAPYEHDTRGALRRVKSGGKEIGYSVDAIGRRIARAEDGVITAGWLYQDALRPAAEYDGQGSWWWQFVYATDRHVPDVDENPGAATDRVV
jgi:hypothetical protein